MTFNETAIFLDQLVSARKELRENGFDADEILSLLMNAHFENSIQNNRPIPSNVNYNNILMTFKDKQLCEHILQHDMWQKKSTVVRAVFIRLDAHRYLDSEPENLEKFMSQSESRPLLIHAIKKAAADKLQ